jgi:ribosomal protein S18 acetylase RimI-like enzyme
MAPEGGTVREAGPDDAPAAARLLHDFNTEFDEPTPELEVLADRVRELLAEGEIHVLLIGDPPHGLALLRIKPSIWTGDPDAYLEELYIAPEHRGHGEGRALLEGAIALARSSGATHLDLTTSEDDTAARGLYERFGFSNREGRPDGPSMLYYEREI